jgi:hypothetical protein
MFCSTDGLIASLDSTYLTHRRFQLHPAAAAVGAMQSVTALEQDRQGCRNREAVPTALGGQTG